MIRLSHVNTLLVVLIILINTFTLAFPYLPTLQFWRQQTFSSNDVLYAQARPEPYTGPVPEENTLVLPGIGLEAAIHEGAYKDTLNKGIWRRPHTSSPDKGGNTVLVGHRFTYRNGAIFYHLDKVKMFDPVVVWWEGKRHVYEVIDIRVVGPDETAIEANTEKSFLTIYTCTPLWTATDRLVVTAREVTI